MTSIACRLPATLAQDIEQHAQDVDRFLKGELSASILKSRRVPRGIYEQRQNGTYMVRVRVPGGAINAVQARALAAVASRHGDGTLHCTTRQDIQLHGVRIEETPDTMRELFRAGLTSKGGGGNTVRNITACPYAGICPAERFDVTPFAVAATEYLIGLPGSYNLPRKYKIAFSGCSADCALAQVNDLGFIARVREGKPGFIVYAGGGMGAESRVGDRMEEWVPTSEVVRMAEAVRRLFDRMGDRRNRHRARLRFAVARVGAERFHEMLTDAVREVTGDGVPGCAARIELAAAPAAPPSDYRALLAPAAAGLLVLRQRQPGYVAVPLRLPLGDIAWQALEALSDLAEKFSAEKRLRVTQDQHLMLRFVCEADLDALRDELQRVLSVDALRYTALHAFTVCTGAATCRLGLCLSQNAAHACAAALAEAGIDRAVLQAVDIRMNGCANACGQHPVGTIGLFGAAQRVGARLLPAYRMLLGARRGEGRTRLGEFAGLVPARRLPAMLTDLLLDFQNGCDAEESFADYFDRKGMGYFQALLERHTATEPGAEDPAFYHDWGRDEEFSLAGRGAGECGAGVFELIAGDLATATRALKPEAASSDDLFAGLLATARALLITQGFDSQNTDAIFRAFETHFLDSGLVDADFRGLLARARGYREGWRDALAGRREEIRRLLDRIELLYSTMDADLRFHVPEAVAAATAPAAPEVAPAISNAAAVELDLSGVACPMNFVKAKLRLEMMEVGSTLGLVLDDGAPVQNVPASFRNEGQEVAEIRDIGDGHWRVLIRKAT